MKCTHGGVLSARSSLAVVALLLAAHAGPLTAQEAIAPTHGYQRVRITSETRPESPLVGTVTSWSPSSISVSTDAGHSDVIPLPEIVRLEISRGSESHVREGALIGGGIGLALGILSSITLATSDGDSWIAPTMGSYLAMTAATTLVGTGLGATIGALIRTERWEETPFPPPTASASGATSGAGLPDSPRPGSLP